MEHPVMLHYNLSMHVCEKHNEEQWKHKNLEQQRTRNVVTNKLYVLFTHCCFSLLIVL